MATTTVMTQADVPAGFRPYVRESFSFFQNLGAIYVRELSCGMQVFGLYVSPNHRNRIGSPHGGMLSTFVDLALGVNLQNARETPESIVTVNLCLDYLTSAKVGDWLEAHVTLRRIGRQFSFADCVLRSGEREVPRASGIFSIVRPINGVKE